MFGWRGFAKPLFLMRFSMALSAILLVDFFGVTFGQMNLRGALPVRI